MKTPEEMAEEFAEDWHKDCDYPPEILRHTKKATASVFLAGYKSKWISFKNKLPVIGEQILIAYNVGDGIKVNQGSRWPENADNPNGKYPWYYCNATIFGAEHALYWMPLPAPPKEET